MATVKFTPENIERLKKEIPQLLYPFMDKLLDILDEGEIEDDDYDEEIGSDPEASYSITFEFDGGHIELYDVKAKYFTVL